MTKLLYQGHASYRITTNEGKIIYIDPYMGVHYDKEADLVLVTHQHYDHNAINKMPHKDSTIVFQNMDAIKEGTYVNTNIYGVDINPVPAYNSVPMHTYPDHLFSEEIAKKFNGINKLVIRPNEEIDL